MREWTNNKSTVELVIFVSNAAAVLKWNKLSALVDIIYVSNLWNFSMKVPQTLFISISKSIYLSLAKNYQREGPAKPAATKFLHAIPIKTFLYAYVSD